MQKHSRLYNELREDKVIRSLNVLVPVGISLAIFAFVSFEIIRTL